MQQEIGRRQGIKRRFRRLDPRLPPLEQLPTAPLSRA